MTVHVAALAHHSPVLRQLVSGPMAEAREGCATLDDIDEAAFVRFCQYAYMGQYEVPGAERAAEIVPVRQLHIRAFSSFPCLSQVYIVS